VETWGSGRLRVRDRWSSGGPAEETAEWLDPNSVKPFGTGSPLLPLPASSVVHEGRKWRRRLRKLGPKSKRHHRLQLFSSAGPPLLQRSLTLSRYWIQCRIDGMGCHQEQQDQEGCDPHQKDRCADNENTSSDLLHGCQRLLVYFCHLPNQNIDIGLSVGACGVSTCAMPPRYRTCHQGQRNSPIRA
jgi:hypothetical protein